MFLGLFKGFDLGQFHYDVCELAKHMHVSFSNKEYKVFNVFYSYS